MQAGRLLHNPHLPVHTRLCFSQSPASEVSGRNRKSSKLYQNYMQKKKNHDSHTGTNPHLKKKTVGDHVITEVINNSLHFVPCDPSYKQNQSSRRINKPRFTIGFVSSGSSTVLNPVSYPIMAVSLIQTIFSDLRVKSHTPLTRSSLIISLMQKF